MSRLLGLGNHRFLLAVLATLLLGLSCAVSASAASTETSCKNLQSTLSAAKAGDTVTLTEVCKSGFPYKLPSLQMTLAGKPGAGFDGGSTAQLEGNGSSPTIEGLIFENAHSTAADSGGALSLNTAPKGSIVALAHDTFSNDVAGDGEGGGARINTAEAPVTVIDSTFTGDSATENGGALMVAATSANLSGDAFTGNSVTGAFAFGGGLSASTVEGPITLSSSQFSGNSSDNEGGGAWLGTEANGTGIMLSGNTFSHNSVSDPSGTSTNPRGYLGGGLALEGESTAPITAVQQGNTFDGNGVSFKAAPVSAMGGGESTTHIALQSTGDRFTSNTLQPPSAAENGESKKVFGWGAGLSVAECGDTTEVPPTVPNVTSTLTNAVVAGNTLQSGPSANGAGIYVGFVCPTAYSTLQLDDSTVSGNTVSGASGPVAGISGGPHDVLALANTIVSGDTGGPELGGFQGLAGVSAVSSDVCSGSAPFAGVGNICAAPLLQDASTGDVHETSSSPTIDAGSNALVPANLTTDFYGMRRIQPGHAFVPACTPGAVVGPTVGPPVVDMGASEFGPVIVPAVEIICTPPHPPAPLGLARFVSLKTSATGLALRLTCVSTNGLGCSGTIFITSDETLKGKKVVAVTAAHSKKVAVRLGQATFSLAAGATATINVKLNATGRSLVRRFHSISSFVLANEATAGNGPVIFLLHGVRFNQAKKHKAKKHKQRRSKHPKRR
jgi:hypothetical protein